MLFNSLEFALYFIMVVAAHFSMPHRFRWAFLLAASCYFYMVFIPKYILILFLVIAVDYMAGLVLERAQGLERRLTLAVSLACNLGILCWFKYFGFFAESLAPALGRLGLDYAAPALKVALPIGLSFHTFQSMAYTIDLYRGKVKAERHPGIFALYVLFFPQLVAGPIERPGHLIGQFRAEQKFEHRRALAGMGLMLWGLFKKMVVADNLSPLVDAAYGHPVQASGGALALATYAFTFQIYCDFSGYSDVARGVAKVLGIDLMKNFDAPYGSASIGEFWRRWHISLSSWFRDYLYLPLGGNQVGPRRWAANVMIVFLVSGLWHGANWTFVCWGLLHGLYRLTSEGTKRAPPRWLGVAATFHAVALAWVFFRARSVGEAFTILARTFDPRTWDGSFGLEPRRAAVCLAGLALLWIVDHSENGRGIGEFGAKHPRSLRSAFAGGLALALGAFGVMESQSFIYFQF